MFAAFSHTRGADPSSYGHTPGWSRPPLGRVRPRGKGFCLGSLDTPMSRITVFGLGVVFGSQGPPGPSCIRRGGALIAPPGPVFHTHVSLSPGFFSSCLSLSLSFFFSLSAWCVRIVCYVCTCVCVCACVYVHKSPWGLLPELAECNDANPRPPNCRL